MKNLMYREDGERVRTWNPHPGCGFNCTYCYGPAQYARFSKCDKCKAFRPHFHPERMKQTFEKGKTYFVESLGDPSFIPREIFQRILDHCASFPDTKFMIQSKEPGYFSGFDYPKNIWLGTTIETDLDKLAMCYSWAPLPSFRNTRLYAVQQEYPELHYYVTFEPIMVCSIRELKDIALYLNADAVYIGRDNHGHHLPEPAEYELTELVRCLRKKLGPERVHTKTLGPAWWQVKR
jgi:DNA repair photolyase